MVCHCTLAGTTACTNCSTYKQFYENDYKYTNVTTPDYTYSDNLYWNNAKFKPIKIFKCRLCGAELDIEDVFCRKCGSKIDWEED